jgi:hypothetical protein
MIGNKNLDLYKSLTNFSPHQISLWRLPLLPGTDLL